MRKKIIAGNWKMNKTPSQGADFVKELAPLVENASCEVVVCPPFPCLDRVGKALKGTNILLGAQNAYWEANGAFTGEVALDMLQDCGVTHVIVGHSERRQFFGETDETVNKRVRAILAANLTPIICVGELLAEREAGTTNDVVAGQIRRCCAGMKIADALRTVIAYEPVWAIGTGKVATTAQAQEVHAMIRGLVASLVDVATAAQVRIQYGGSMKPDNAAELLAEADIDGGLIGGAALKADSFAAIIAAAK